MPARALLSTVCCLASCRCALAAAVACCLAFCRSCRAAVAAAVDLGGAMEIRAKKESDQSASNSLRQQPASACCGPRAAPDPAAARFFPWEGPRSRDAHERGAHDGRISGGGHQRVADISPDLCFSAVKNQVSQPESQIVKSLFFNLISDRPSCFWMRTQL